MIFRLVIALLLIVNQVWADSETRTCSSASGTNWTNPTNILANDANYAVYNNTARNPINVTNCGFTNVNGTVDGITVRLIGCGTGTTAQRRVAANLLNLGTCTEKGTLNQAQCTSWTDQNIGGAADTWSCTSVSASAVTDSAFGATIRDNDATATELREQYLEITVNYTPTTTSTSTSTSSSTSSSTTTSTSSSTTTSTTLATSGHHHIRYLY